MSDEEYEVFETYDISDEDADLSEYESEKENEEEEEGEYLEEEEDVSPYHLYRESIRALEDLDDNCAKVLVIPDHNKTTSNIISKYEFCEAIGVRATQIERGAPVFTDVAKITNPIEMAKKEFFDRKSPLILERVIIDNKEQRFKVVEEWKVREMTFPPNIYY